MAHKELITRMHDLIADTMECNDLLYAGLISDKMAALEAADKKLERIGEEAAALGGQIAKVRRTGIHAAHYITVPEHIIMVAQNMGRITVVLKKKIREGILFSDKAIAESGYIFERTSDILLHAKDMVLVHNTLVARHLVESERAIVNIANDFSTQHEERLIEGTCSPNASPLYLEMMDAFRAIALHARQAGMYLIDSEQAGIAPAPKAGRA